MKFDTYGWSWLMSLMKPVSWASILLPVLYLLQKNKQNWIWKQLTPKSLSKCNWTAAHRILTMLCSFHLDLVLCCRPKLGSMWLCCLDRNHSIDVADDTVVAADVADAVDVAGVVGAADAVGLQHMLPSKRWRRPTFYVSKSTKHKKQQQHVKNNTKKRVKLIGYD